MKRLNICFTLFQCRPKELNKITDYQSILTMDWFLAWYNVTPITLKQYGSVFRSLFHFHFTGHYIITKNGKLFVTNYKESVICHGYYSPL